MAENPPVPADYRYRYPGPEAEFLLYNFHAQDSIDPLVDALLSNDGPRVMQIFGQPRGGRHYLLRSAAFHASRRGREVTVEKLNLDGYEPDAPLRGLLTFLAARSQGSEGSKLAALGERTKVEVKVNPINLLIAELGVKTEFSVDEILRFFSFDSSTAGPRMPQREALAHLLDRLTRGRRFVLHLPDAHIADLALLLRLVDETEMRTDFFLSLAYPEQHAGAPRSRRPSLDVHIPNWTREEMQRAFAERFQPHRVPADFLEFAWSSPGAVHSRETFAQLLLRVVGNNWLTITTAGTWIVDPNWRSNPALVEEFRRDLLDPIIDIRSQLQKSGLQENKLWQLDDFLDAAALCHPAVPVTSLLKTAGVAEEDCDAFIDWLDESLYVDDEDGILENLGFQHPGFPSSLLLYRFRNPLLPEVLRRGIPSPGVPAEKILKNLSVILRPDTRAVAQLFLRLTEKTGTAQLPRQYEAMLSFWSSIDEAEALAEAVAAEIKERRLSPSILWSIIERSKGSWPPARRLALILAYGQQPDGVPFDQLFDYQLSKGEVLYEMGHAPAAIEAAEEALSAGPPVRIAEAGSSLHTLLGLSHMALGHSREAHDHLELAMTMASNRLPVDELLLAGCMSNLAAFCVDEAAFTQAEPLLQRSLSIHEQILGPDHPDVAANLNNLASLYDHQADFTRSRPLHERALAIREKALGPDHLDVARSLSNLAALSCQEADYAESRLLCERTLAIREKRLGPEHPDVATSLNLLAMLHQFQADYANAEIFLLRAIAIEEKLLGPENPHLAASLNNLALLYAEQAEYEKAEPPCQRALAIREKALGPDHPDVADSLGTLGLLYKRAGELRKAEPLYRRALAISEKALGPEHPRVAACLNNLAMLDDHPDLVESEPLLLRALAIREKTLGPEHPDVANILGNLAPLYVQRGDQATVEILLRRALSIREKVLGPNHPDTIIARRALEYAQLFGSLMTDSSSAG